MVTIAQQIIKHQKKNPSFGKAATTATAPAIQNSLLCILILFYSGCA